MNAVMQPEAAIVEWDSCPTHAAVQRCARIIGTGKLVGVSTNDQARVVSFGCDVRQARAILVDGTQLWGASQAMEGMPFCHRMAMPFAQTWIEVSHSDWRTERIDGVLAIQQGPDEPVVAVGVERMIDLPNMALPTWGAIIFESKFQSFSIADPESIAALHSRSVDEINTQGRETAADVATIVGVITAWLGSCNVELGDAPVSRQVRRHAQRSDRHIPQVIQARRSKRASAISSDRKIEYSHRFEVRAHFQHHAKGPIWDAWKDDTQRVFDHPDLGPCVQVWNPGAIKGPESKSLIPKVRAIKELAA